MLISELLVKFDEIKKYEIRNEQMFETFALASSEVRKKYCTFVEAKEYVEGLSDNAVMVFTTSSLSEEIISKGKGVCIVDNPRICFFKMHNRMKDYKQYVRQDRKTIIGNNCTIHPSAYISENNVCIGDNVIIEEFVSIKENTVIEDDVIIRSHTVIGGEGFEHKRNGDEIVSVKHLGGVVIEKGVELQQNNCIDKAIYPWDNTVIGELSKTDNNVHIAHADKIGKRVFIAACTCIAGRVHIGDDVWIGPGVTVINGISIGNQAEVSIGSVVTKPVRENERVTGNFAIEHKKFINFIKEITNM